MHKGCTGLDENGRRRENGHSFTDSFLFFCYLVIEDDREIKLYSFYIANIKNNIHLT